MILGVDTKDHAAPAIYLLLLGDTALWRNSQLTLPFFENVTVDRIRLQTLRKSPNFIGKTAPITDKFYKNATSSQYYLYHLYGVAFGKEGMYVFIQL